MVGSPPQIDTIGAPHSSAAATHCLTVSFCVIVDRYSRMRPQPVHVRLQACSGSSIITRGKRLMPRSRLPAMYPVRSKVRLSGNLTKTPFKLERRHDSLPHACSVAPAHQL